MKWHFFPWNGHFYFEMGKSTENGQKSNQNLRWKEIWNQWISRYVEIRLLLQIENPHDKVHVCSRVLCRGSPRVLWQRSGIDAFRPLMESSKITKLLLGQPKACPADPCSRVTKWPATEHQSVS
jgi:hypothetical protein